MRRRGFCGGGGGVRRRRTLHGDDGDLIYGAESCLQSGEGDDNANNGTVGVAHNKAFLNRVLSALVWYDGEVVEVDGGDDERDEIMAPVIFGIAENSQVGLLESSFNISCNIAV